MDNPSYLGSSSNIIDSDASVAQLVEQPFRKWQVPSSSLGVGSISNLNKTPPAKLAGGVAHQQGLASCHVFAPYLRLNAFTGRVDVLLAVPKVFSGADHAPTPVDGFFLR